MQFWMPVVSELKGKEYRTLADVPEKVPCLVYFKSAPDCLVRARVGNFAARCTRDGGFTLQDDLASGYSLQQILVPIPDPPKPTIGSIPDGRCFYRGNPEFVEWKHGEHILSFGAGRKSSPMCCTHIGYYSKAEQVTVLNLEMKLQDVPVTKASD